MQMMKIARGAAALGSAAALSWSAFGQVEPLQQDDVGLDIDSGFVTNKADERAVIFSSTVSIAEASWLRISFAQATLGRAPAGGEPTVLRLTGLHDGAVQHLDEAALWQWQDTSAYFNGGKVHLELVSDPGAQPSRVRITSVWAGPPVYMPEIDSICGPTDDRELSIDRRVARVIPIGCTAWIIDDPNRCQLTAGHCTGGSFDVLEFNVPLSSSGGSIIHPPPSDQYVPDPSSIQSNGGQGTGNDWAYFGCLPNSETGMTPFEAQGEYFVLADPPAPSGQAIRVTGNGSVQSPVPPQWNFAQKTHAGPLFDVIGSWLQYQTDTTGGNSGSPVINEDTGEAIGIHTHGGCAGGYNSGTGVNNSGLRIALANPRGVCVPIPPLSFGFPDGLPEALDPMDQSIRVIVGGVDGAVPQSGTGKLHFRIGEGEELSLDMVEVEPNVYDAVFPALPCAAVVSFYFSAETTDGEVVFEPVFAPDATFSAVVASDIIISFADDFETDQGWTVVDDAGLTAGSWERGIPIGGGDRGDPPTDADGSGRCYLTENADGNSDVDGGTTTLISLRMDATDPESRISYYRWYSNTAGANPASDVFGVDVSDDGGATWKTLERVGPDGPEVSGGWYFKEFLIADIPGIENSDLFRIRFIASDLGEGSVVEAAVDGVQVRTLVCGASVPGDTDGDGDVDFTDLLQVVADWGPCPAPPADCPADLDGDGVVGFTDLLTVIENWTL